jgi:hypothetical protein
MEVLNLKELIPEHKEGKDGESILVKALKAVIKVRNQDQRQLV